MSEDPTAPPDRPFIIRIAYRDEADAAAAIYIQADRAAAASRRELLRRPAEGDRSEEEREATADLRAWAATAGDAVFLAFADDPAPVGVGAVVVRGRHARITFLFVRSAWQGRGIGRALLDRLQAHGAAVGCDVTSLYASHDPRALQLYLRSGFQPRPPLVSLVAPRPAFPALDLRDGLDAHPLHADEPAQLATVGDIDAVVRGVRRPADLQAWIAAGAQGALLTRRGTAIPVGYFVVGSAATRTPIGPVAAIDVERVPAVLGRALAAAGTLPSKGIAEWRVELPSENQAALPPLFTAGFRVRRLTPYLATAPIGRWDRYIFHDGDLH